MAQRSSATRRLLLLLGGLLGLVVLLAAAGYGLGFFGGGPEGVRVDVADAERRTLTQVVTAFGRAQPEVEVIISPDVSGEIVQLPVREGDRVQEGDLLVALKPDNYQAQVQQQRAGVSQAQATLAERRADSLQAKLEFDRQKRLYEREVISESDYETARSRYQQAVARLEAARYQVESAEARLQDALELLAKTRIYAPMDGTVSKLNVEAGERVVGTSQMQGTEIMKVARLDQMELEVDVNENDVVNVALDDSATISVDAFPDRPFRGRVLEIANSARVSNQGTQEQVTNFPVKVRVLDAHNPDPPAISSDGASGGVTRPEVPPPPSNAPKLRPGMSGTVDIYTHTVHDVVAVPIQAVTVRDFNALRADTSDTEDEASSSEDLRKVVFIAASDTVRMAEVRTGIADDTHIEIRSGLTGGETVVVGPYSAVSRTLEPGMRIRTRSNSSPESEVVASME